MPAQRGPREMLAPADELALEDPAGLLPNATDRLAFGAGELRTRTVRGAGINGAFLLVVQAVALVQGLVVARVLGPGLVGLYGIVSVTVMTLIALKRVGIDEAYVQQDEQGQEEEFQRAFTLELGLSLLFTVLIAAAAPLLAAAYGDGRVLLLTLALAYMPIAFALQAPLWIFFRRMDFVRQRSLQAAVPLVSFTVTVPLAVSGAGVWSLVAGGFAGNAAGVVLALRASPYRLALRFDRGATRRYLAFSWPIFVVTAGGLVVNQGQVLAFKLDGGLRAVGFLSLAVTLTRFADRADQVISPTIYPVICAVRERARTLEQLFTTASRASAVWALGLGAGLVLFAPDLVSILLGRRWTGAIVLMQGLAAASALYQLGYCWIAFARGLGRPRPPAVEAVVAVATFGLIAVPALFLAGVAGFVLGMAASSLAILAVRAHFVRRLLPEVRVGRLLGRALWPLVPACAVVGTIRLAAWGGERTVLQAAVEAGAYVAVYAAVTFAAERGLVRELLAAARRAPAAQPA